jgi:hypothetical protein
MTKDCDDDIQSTYADVKAAELAIAALLAFENLSVVILFQNFSFCGSSSLSINFNGSPGPI